MGIDWQSARILLDTPSKQPAIEFPAYAAALADVVQNSAPRFAVGVFGRWGSGKTTLMDEIARRLDPDRCVVVKFSAWRYEKEQHLIVPLLDVMRDELIRWAEARRPADSSAGDSQVRSGNGAFRDAAMNTASVVGRAASVLLAGFSFKLGLGNAASLSYDVEKTLRYGLSYQSDDGEALATDQTIPRSLYHASFMALKDAFEKFVEPDQFGYTARRLVIFVDDLDRCLPEAALSVLESMKLFFDLPGFVFVVGLDREAVEGSIDVRYQPASGLQQVDAASEVRRQVTGEEYIKKIFQVPFSLPPITLIQLGQVLTQIATESGMHSAQADFVCTRVKSHMQYVVGADGINPRELKRYINECFLLMKIRPNDFNPDVVLALNTIALHPEWLTLRRYLLSEKQHFILALQEVIRNDDSALLHDLAPEVGELPEDFRRFLDDPTAGQPLLNVDDISEYIAVAEMTRSSISTELASILPRLSKVRRDITSLGSPDCVMTPTALRDTVRRMEGHISSGDLGRSAGPALHSLAALRRELDEGATRYATPPAGEDGEFEAWRERAATLAKEAFLKLKLEAI